MAAMYRTMVRLDGGVEIRANVYVLSTASNYQKGGDMRETAIQVTFPPRRGADLEGVRNIMHDGKEYLVQGDAVAIRSLGRIDHWEVTGLRVTG